jgi:hypothetical protein
MPYSNDPGIARLCRRSVNSTEPTFPLEAVNVTRTVQRVEGAHRGLAKLLARSVPLIRPITDPVPFGPENKATWLKEFGDPHKTLKLLLFTL